LPQALQKTISNQVCQKKSTHMHWQQPYRLHQTVKTSGSRLRARLEPAAMLLMRESVWADMAAAAPLRG
jgi:hypothetical protein